MNDSRMSQTTELSGVMNSKQMILWQVTWIMIVGILFLSIYGKQSLTTRTILAPQNLWQVLFNQIPSYIEETDGPLRICLVDIGVKDEKQEDANDICREAEEVIENKVETVKKEIKERAKKLENNSQGTRRS